jgi:hypothetical protein
MDQYLNTGMHSDIIHYYDDLPYKGLGKNFDNVGLLEYIILSPVSLYYTELTSFTFRNMHQRAAILNADIHWMSIRGQNPNEADRMMIWFKAKKGNDRSI